MFRKRHREVVELLSMPKGPVGEIADNEYYRACIQRGPKKNQTNELFSEQGEC